ncbi:MAG TPA: hypothetical protein PKD72_01720, partial [Gemmatales bacterium]|nr:hypothetical protein [Gemmatales bacterium]
MFFTSYAPSWSEDDVARAWDGYAEPLLRQISAKVMKPRQKLPLAELKQKLLHWHDNPPLVDRRLRELSLPARTLLAIPYLGKRTLWRLGTLLEVVSSFSQQDSCDLPTDNLKVIEELFLYGMIIPVAQAERSKLKSFEDWLGQGQPEQYRVWVAPKLLARAAHVYDSLPELSTVTVSKNSPIEESDGLEWFLRLGVAWQQIHDTPAKITQQGQFFKRDQDRFLEDPLLNQPLTHHNGQLPQQGHLIITLGLSLGIFRLQEPLIICGRFPETWNEGWRPALVQFLGTLADLQEWSVTEGWCGWNAGTNPWPASMLLILATLIRLEADQWTAVQNLANWLSKHHCYWSPREHSPDLSKPILSYLQSILAPLRFVQLGTSDEGEIAVRLSPLGRSILLESDTPKLLDFPKTLLLQPNLEMMAYRQGLTPKLVVSLSKLASWKSLGAACLLTIDQPSVHRGLEAGSSFEEFQTLLEQHTVHAPPGNVVEAIRTWAAKRDRLAVYQGIYLLEFLSKEDRDDALARGQQGIPLAERYLLVEQEESIDYRHFRTLGTRDYMLPPTQCVMVAEDGITLTVDPARADLLLETELLRFTTASLLNETRQYKITYETLDIARNQGLSLRFLGEWFLQRTG